MKRYVVAGVLQALPALLAFLIVVSSAAQGVESPTELLPLCVLAAVSAGTAILAVKAREIERLRGIFVLVEGIWVLMYAVLLFHAYQDAQRALALVQGYKGEDALLRLTLSVSVAASQAGAGIVTSIERVLFVLHALCFALGLWGWLGGMRERSLDPESCAR